MKLILTKEEIIEILNTHLIHRGYEIKFDTKFKVVWDQEYDSEATDITYEVELLKPHKNSL